MGGGFADGVNSGTNAVFAALGAMQLEPGSEVVVPPITDPGGAMPVAILNCIPIPADSAPGSYNMGPEQLEAAISEKTSAVIVAHIGGIPADMEGIMEVARRHDLPVLEDCAQAHGARLNGQLVGTFGDIAAFSTMGGKHMATLDQGGLVFTPDEELCWKVKRFADRGKPFNLDAETNILPGLNMNLGDLRAGIGRGQLRKVPRIVERRREVTGQICDAIAGLNSVEPPVEPEGAESSYWFLPVGVNTDRIRVSKDHFARAIGEEGIPVNPSYRHIPCEQIWLRDRASCPTPWIYREADNIPLDLTNARKTAESHFNIGIHEGYDAQSVQDTVDALSKIDAAYRR
jgi:dTDP-4-amino-4,6-dideoxygalactose transaminase